ncbi:unnamed protein product [Bemisia tabaci]|uniref:Uncharacterized protein n=1 Tax=Bemisia tabaci TaxID=7038 RepID=A0A9P0EYR5_BEMTA|nr:unnamed protein product [Bemisia tabaci]
MSALPLSEYAIKRMSFEECVFVTLYEVPFMLEIGLNAQLVASLYLQVDPIHHSRRTRYRKEEIVNDKIILITFIIVVVGVNATVVENSSETNIKMCPFYPEIKCAPSTLTDVLLFIFSLLALICSTPYLYSNYLSSDCKFRFNRMSRENNNRKVDDISVDLKFGEGEGIDIHFMVWLRHR